MISVSPNTFSTLLALGLMCSLSQELVAKDKTFLGMPVEAIDIHMHPGSYQTMGPLGKNFIKNALPGFIPEALKDITLTAAGNLMLDPYGAFIGIKKECEKAGLELCGLFAVYAPDTWGVTDNAYIIKKLDSPKNKNKLGKPAFFGLASVRMQNWDMGEKGELAQLREALKHPMIKGIKLAFIHNGIALDDARYDSIYQVAEDMNVPVYHHVGSSPLQKLADFSDDDEREAYVASYDPAKLERVIARFPKVKFILGHMGFDFNKEGFDFSPTVYDLATRYPNVILEISAFGRAAYDPDGQQMDRVLKTIKDSGLIGRTVYGSDGPGSPGGTEKYMDLTLRSMDRVGFSFAEAEAVLKDNAVRIFKLENLIQ